MKPEPEDYYAALVQQRNDALNLVANLMAEVAMLRRMLDAGRAGAEKDGEEAGPKQAGAGEVA